MKRIRIKRYLILLLAIVGCGGGAGNGGFGGGSGSLISGNSGLPTESPGLFTAGPERMPAVFLTFTSELQTIAVTPDGKKLYATDTLHDAVSIVDLDDEEVIDILDVGSGPTYLAISPKGRRAFIANSASGVVTVLNTSNDEIISTIVVGDSPFGIAVTPDGEKAYVANRFSDTVSVINAVTGEVILEALDVDPTGPTPSVNERPTLIAITPDGSKAYVINQRIGTISVIDVATDTVVSTITVGNDPSSLAVTPDGSTLYVTNAADNSVSVINASSDEITTTIEDVGTGPAGIAVTPDGSRVYLANPDKSQEDCGSLNNSLSIIDVATNTLLAKDLPVGESPLGLVITGDSEKAYVFSACTNTLSVIANSLIPSDPMGAVKTISIDNQSRSKSIAIAPDSQKVYVAHPNSISVLDVTTDIVVAEIPARGSGPTALTVTLDGTKVYTANSGSNSVSVIDVNQDEHVVTLAVGSRPSHLIIPKDVNKVYIANSGFSRRPDSTVSVIDVLNDQLLTTISLDDPTTFFNEGIGPLRLTVTPDGSKVFVAHFGDFFPTDIGKSRRVSIIDTLTDTLSDQIDGINPGHTDIKIIEVGTDAMVALLTNFLSVDDSISIIDITDPAFRLDTIFGDSQSGINQPIAIAVTKNSAKAVLTSYNGEFFDANFELSVQHRVSIIDLTNIDLSNIDLTDGVTEDTVFTNGPNPSAVAITPDDTKAYILNSGDQSFRCQRDDDSIEPCPIGESVTVLDLNTNSVVADIPVGKRPTDIVITPDGQKVYITNFFDNTVSVIETAGDTVKERIDVGAGPVGVLITPDGTKVYVANSVGKTLSVIDVASDIVVKTIPVKP